MAVQLQSLLVKIAGDNKDLLSKLKDSEEKANAFGKALKVALGAGGLVAGAGVLLVKRLKDTAIEMDRIGKKATDIGISVEALIGLSHAADQGGASAELLENALIKLQRRTVEAALGNKVYNQAIQQMGLDSKKFVELNVEDRFKLMADRLQEMENPAERVNVAFQLMGREGTKLLTTMQSGSAGMAALQKEAENLGLTMNRTTIFQFERFNDALDTFRKVSVGFRRQLAAAFAPVFAAVVAVFRAWVTGLRTTSDNFKTFAENAIKAIVWVLTFLKKWELRIKLVGLAYQFVAESVKNAMDRGLASLTFQQRIDAITAKMAEYAGELEKLSKPGGVSELASLAMKEYSDALNDIEKDLKKVLDKMGQVGKHLPPKELKPKKIKQELDPLNEFFKRATDAQGALRAALAETFEGLSMGLGRATAQALLFSESVGEAFGNVFRAVVSELLSALVAVGVRMAVTAALGKTLMKSTLAAQAAALAGVSATAAAAGATVAASWSAAAIAASIATFGAAAGIGLTAYLSALAAGSAATIAAQVVTGFTGGLSGGLGGIAHGGLTEVPRTGTYVLDKGERVISGDQNRDLTRFLRAGGAGGGVIVHNHSSVSVSAQRGRGGGLEIVLTEVGDAVRRRVIGDILDQIERGYGDINSALRRNYALARRV